MNGFDTLGAEALAELPADLIQAAVQSPVILDPGAEGEDWVFVVELNPVPY